MKSTIPGLLAVGLLAGPIGAQAVTWEVTNGVLSGASGVSVGGTLYDVEFLDGTCAAVFDGCDSAADFAFNTAADATLASWALFDQVLLNVAGLGNFDSNPWLTLGCVGSPNLCVLLTPFTVSGSNFSASAAYNEIGLDYPADREGGGGGPITYDFTQQNGTTFARWRLAGTVPVPVAVPEPGTLVLLGLGLAGLGLRRRRESNPRARCRAAGRPPRSRRACPPRRGRSCVPDAASSTRSEPGRSASAIPIARREWSEKSSPARADRRVGACRVVAAQVTPAIRRPRPRGCGRVPGRR